MKNQPVKFTKLEPSVKKPSKLKKYFYGFVIILTIFCLISTTYGVYSFFYNYSLQSPIRLQSPIVSRHRDVIISPVGSKKTSSIIDIGKIADRIYQLESSGGRNDSCRNLGLYNGYGYMENKTDWKCFGSHEEVRQLVINWLTTHIGKYGLEKSLCIYNQGINETGCTYSENYLSLN